MQSLYWHDYETWGVNPAIDRPSQFAGLRTDENLKVVGDPLVIYCKPADDILPQPEACLVTGITPQLAAAKGLCEPDFIRRILTELGAPGTCGVGYNSIRFDDEVTRYSAFRNYHDPYEREWKNGNSRWDIIDTVRACFALRPEGIEWPVVEAKPSFRLELLTQANGIEHGAAHDALSDVEATINMARLVRQKQPELYNYLYQNKSKAAARAAIDLNSHKPVVHVSSMFKAEQGCLALMMPLAMHPGNKNAVIAFDLSCDPEDLLRLDPEAIAERVFTSESDLQQGQRRVPLKQIHLNKSPILLTPKLLTSPIAKRLGLDLQGCERHWQQIKAHQGANLANKVQQAMKGQAFATKTDPEQMLYDGFINNADKPVMERVRCADAKALESGEFVFNDKRLQAMLLGYKGRHYPQCLSAAEQKQWLDFCRGRLGKGESGLLSMAEFKSRITELGANTLDADKNNLLQQLSSYADLLATKYDLGR